MYLLPEPQKLVINNGFLKQRSVDLKGVYGEESFCKDARIRKALDKLPDSEDGTKLEIRLGETGEEGYTLTIEESKITIMAARPAGTFYAIQTLRQIFDNKEVPCLTIEDEPGFAYRGFYHDVTRGKVPKAETIKELIDTMAYYKMNSLQLYIEHTFPFKELGDHIEKTGYLTPEEIRELDDYCYENFIEFIPSIATFGHLYDLLEREEYRKLREIEDFVEDQIFWPQRMAHHTIDPTREESIEIIKSLLDQFMPLFRTDKFNICCDETFDLKNGKHKDQDTGRLYIDFVKKIIAHLESKGKKVMMCADILLQHPETIEELPEGVEFLNWTYSAEPKEEPFAVFGNMDCEQIVCPGTSSWSRLVEGIDKGSKNILKLGEYGYKYHAKGMLNTNWGDYGNPCSLELAMHGLVLGAAKSWNEKTDRDQYFTDSINYLLYKNDKAVTYLTMLDEAHNKLNWNMLTYCYSNCIYEKKFAIRYPAAEDVVSAQLICKEVKEKLSGESWERDEYRQELLIAAEGIMVIAELFAKLAGYQVERYSDTKQWLKKYREKWVQKNKESELHEIEKMFLTLEENR